MKNARAALFLLAIATSAVAVTMTVPSVASSTTSSALLDAPWGAADGCTHQCRECDGPPGGTSDYHDIVVAVENHHSSSHLENCNIGSCKEHSCGGEEMELAAITWSAARSASGARLLELMKEESTQVRFNAKRGALQLYCDAGALIASLPLTTTQVDQLSALLDPDSGPR